MTFYSVSASRSICPSTCCSLSVRTGGRYPLGPQDGAGKRRSAVRPGKDGAFPWRRATAVHRGMPARPGGYRGEEDGGQLRAQDAMAENSEPDYSQKEGRAELFERRYA